MISADHPMLSHVTERDIDLLVLEELCASRRFGLLFTYMLMHKAGFRGGVKEGSVQPLQSVKRPGKTRGETDLFVGFEIDLDGQAEDGAFLIENKIDADFTPRQPERYQEEAQRLRDEFETQFVGTALLAPAEYHGQLSISPLFDSVISYEELRTVLEKSAETGGAISPERLTYKLKLIDQAINRNRRGYEPETHDGMTRFWDAYYQLAERVAPSLAMQQPGDKAVDSHFICFNQALDFSQVFKKGNITHKMRHDRVDIQLRDFGEVIEELQPYLATILPEDIEARKANKSLALGGTVPPVDPHKGFEAQEDNIRQCLEYARRLQSWLQANESQLHQILLQKA